MFDGSQTYVGIKDQKCLFVNCGKTEHHYCQAVAGDILSRCLLDTSGLNNIMQVLSFFMSCVQLRSEPRLIIIKTL